MHRRFCTAVRGMAWRKSVAKATPLGCTVRLRKGPAKSITEGSAHTRSAVGTKPRAEIHTASALKQPLISSDLI